MRVNDSNLWSGISRLTAIPEGSPVQKRVIQVEERPPLLLNLPLSLQHLFAMFGATVLVPFLFKVNPTTCLFMNGIGTLLYLFLTRGKIPSYLGSSFAFISLKRSRISESSA